MWQMHKKWSFSIKDFFIFLCSECEAGINTEREMGLLVSEDLHSFAKWIFKIFFSRISHVETQAYNRIWHWMYGLIFFLCIVNVFKGGSLNLSHTYVKASIQSRITTQKI